MMMFRSDEEKAAYTDYVISVYGECVDEKTAERLVAEKYGEEIARKVAEELRGWD